MNYGLLTLVLLQFCISAVCVIAAVRLWNIQSAHERENAALALLVSQAKADAASALAMVSNLELSHYKALQTRQLAIETEVAGYHIGLNSLTESVQSLSAKLASREKLERQAQAKSAGLVPGSAPAPAVPDGPMTLEQLIASGQAIPLGGNPASEPARNGHTFGRKVG